MNLLNGFTGLFSLGQAGFMAIGAYSYIFLQFLLSIELRYCISTAEDNRLLHSLYSGAHYRR